jgi:ribosomal protein L32
MPGRMPRYDVRNDGVGPYAVFYCDRCDREYRSQPDIAGTVAKDLGRSAMGGLLRNIPVVGSAVASNVVGEDPRYSTTLTPQQLQQAWGQVESYFGECAQCHQIVCMSDFDSQTGYCNECSPRRAQIAQAEAEQAAGVVKGFAAAFGLSDALRGVGESIKAASANVARCPRDGTVAAPGTRFCPECGGPMEQPATVKCPQCGADTQGAKFCPNCGAKVETPAAASVCPSCGTEAKGARFCPNCGTKLA